MPPVKMTRMTKIALYSLRIYLLLLLGLLAVRFVLFR
jgi:hypothetical protein